MQKASDPATLLYSPHNLTLTPAATRSGCKAHTVPPL